tara:strand:+ start:926 stop:1855 length:930 start_codon:yes stop_codon:yes gene_type:complete
MNIPLIFFMITFGFIFGISSQVDMSTVNASSIGYLIGQVIGLTFILSIPLLILSRWFSILNKPLIFLVATTLSYVHLVYEKYDENQVAKRLGNDILEMLEEANEDSLSEINLEPKSDLDIDLTNITTENLIEVMMNMRAKIDAIAQNHIRKYPEHQFNLSASVLMDKKLLEVYVDEAKNLQLSAENTLNEILYEYQQFNQALKRSTSMEAFYRGYQKTEPKVLDQFRSSYNNEIEIYKVFEDISNHCIALSGLLTIQNEFLMFSDEESLQRYNNLIERLQNLENEAVKISNDFTSDVESQYDNLKDVLD